MAFFVGHFTLTQNRVHAFDDALIEQFRTMAPAAWQNDLTKSFNYRAEVTITTESANRATARKKFLAKEQLGHRLIEEIPLEDDPKTIISVYAFNRDYDFTLHKPAFAKDWILTNLLIGRTNGEPLTGDYSARLAQGIHEILWLVGPTPLPQLIKERTFKILGAQSVRLGDDSCIKIEFDNTHELKTESGSPVQSGWFIVDPNQSWCVRDYSVKTTHANAIALHSVEKLTIRSSALAGIPLPVERITMVRTTPRETGPDGSETIRRTVSVYQIDETAPVALSEFRLPAYHLPEPEGLDWSYLWYHALGIATLIAASVILHRIYRKKNPSA